MNEQPGQHGSHNYIRRHGRMTKAQSFGLETLVPKYVCGADEIILRAAGKPVGVEIGFGMGHALLDWAVSAPTWQLCGIELYKPGVGALAAGLHREGVEHVCIVEQPAQEVLAQIGADAIDEVRIFFPDPWPKKRHFKRRLIQPDFVAALAQVLKPDGLVRLATDWTPYAQWIRECFATCDAFAPEVDHIRQANEDMVVDSARQTTKFERRGEKLGHEIHDLVYRQTRLSVQKLGQHTVQIT